MNDRESQYYFCHWAINPKYGGKNNPNRTYHHKGINLGTSMTSDNNNSTGH
ncbi:MAG: hypothetical protein WBE34_04185 [Candidatus Nitrosopolaris sp.]